uniref:CCT-eta n=1 Tax=Podarcis muralis TaxID=64176 RepID=A0A670J8N8_PODMU
MLLMPVILLKEGTDTSQGIPQLVSNINACQVIAEAGQTSRPSGHGQTLVDTAKSRDVEATQLGADKIKKIAVKIKKTNREALQSLLKKCASTALSSKPISHQKEFFAKMVTDAIMMLDELLQIKVIGIKKVQGGLPSRRPSLMLGFEKYEPKRYESPKITLLNIELELKAEKDNAEVRVHTVQDYQAIVDAKWSILYDELDKLHKSGAKVILSKLPTGGVATQYFADRDMFCAGRVPEEDLKRTMMACGGSIQTSVNSLTDYFLGRCVLFEETDLHYNPAWSMEQFMAEMVRPLHNAIVTGRRAINNDSVVAGAGAIETEISKYLPDYSRTIHGNYQQLSQTSSPVHGKTQTRIPSPHPPTPLNNMPHKEAQVKSVICKNV